jgi:hypothetical protein
VASERQPYVHEAELRLEPGADPRAPGGAVTVALCGSSEHEGPCRWPHNNDHVVSGGATTFRTLFVVRPDEEAEVRELIDAALRGGDGWTLARAGERALEPEEQELADRLAQTPEP